MGFKEEEIFIIGQFGLVGLHFKAINKLLGHLIVNLELKLCQFGKVLNNSLLNKIEIIALLFCWHIKDTIVNLAL